jgi:phenylacetate-coenzyme A ligase PaaK-like adenylate-forming protein
MIDKYLNTEPYGMTTNAKRKLLLKDLNNLTKYHADYCKPYQNIIKGLWSNNIQAKKIEDVPFIPVSLFKALDLRSVEENDIRSTMTSSGTTGQTVSKVYIDAETSKNQQKGLANSLQHILGKKRLPMLVLDTDEAFKNPKYMNARGAGVLGMMRYGREHSFALSANLEPDVEAINNFLEAHGSSPFFMFGFTYLVWSRFHEILKGNGIDLANGTLIHSGGWKKMIESSVDNEEFRNCFNQNFNLSNIYNFYGMVEQLGSIFLEGPNGLLYPPNFSDVIIRDPKTFDVLPSGKEGVVQVCSILPSSYPGHSLLTEDIGVIESCRNSEDGWNGEGLKIIGRIPKAEIRGCSDVISQQESV